MVGGCIYPYKEALKLGANDLVKMFGSVAAVRERFNTVLKSGKVAIFVYFDDAGNKGAFPVTLFVPTENGYNMEAGMFVITLIIDKTTAVATVSMKN